VNYTYICGTKVVPFLWEIASIKPTDSKIIFALKLVYVINLVISDKRIKVKYFADI